jgi:hypothetical protein
VDINSYILSELNFFPLFCIGTKVLACVNLILLRSIWVMALSQLHQLSQTNARVLLVICLRCVCSSLVRLVDSTLLYLVYYNNISNNKNCYEINTIMMIILVNSTTLCLYTFF